MSFWGLRFEVCSLRFEVPPPPWPLANVSRQTSGFCTTDVDFYQKKFKHKKAKTWATYGGYQELG